MTIPVQQFPILSSDQANPLATGLAKGMSLYKQFLINKNLPQQLQQQALQQQLANELAQVKLHYAPEQIQTNLAKERLETQNPLLKLTGPAAQIGGALWLQQHPEFNSAVGKPGHLTSQNNQSPLSGLNQEGVSSLPGTLADSILHNLQTSEQSKQAFSDYYNKRAQGYAYQQMPVDFKNQVIAQAQGLGYNPYESSQAFSEGKTILDLAKAKGYDPNSPEFWPEPQYAPTGATRTLNQKREQAGAELDALGKKLSDWTAPYSSRVYGYSPKQIAEALAGENKDSQAKFIAARILAPEFSSIRMRALAGQVGIGAIKEISDKAMTDLNIFQSLVSPDVYKKANQYANQAIEEALSAAQKAGNLPGSNFNKTNDEVISLGGIHYRRLGPNQWEPVK
jgi:hypothetical protein